MDYYTDYKEDAALRGSFDALAREVFGISFESWYQGGFWDGRYVCHSLVEGGTVVSNVSVTRMDLVLQGREVRAWQVGTVMTREGYRGRGLAARLMNRVLEQYRDRGDLWYLFPNESVMSFYPRYGFLPGRDVYYRLQVPRGAGGSIPPGLELTKIDVNDRAQRRKLVDGVNSRSPLSSRFDTRGCASIYMWHCLNGLRDCIYRITGTDTYIVFYEDDNTLGLFDIIADRRPPVQEILGALASRAGNRELRLHILPDELPDYSWPLSEHENEDMFFLPGAPETSFAHQLLAHT